MARKAATRTGKKAPGGKAREDAPPRMRIDDTYSIGGYCSAKPAQRRSFDRPMDSARLEAITVNEKKWANGTRLRFHFFDQPGDGQTVTFADGSTGFVGWAGPEEQKAVVREAFETWKSVGIGLDFEETDERGEAEIRVGFMAGDGSWSYIGRDILNRGPSARTMNFGWDLTGDDGLTTALHEIGHTLGMPHEHQSPFAGIVWNEEAVYRDLAQPPNSWSHETTFHNIIRKIDPKSVTGTEWDKDSVMEYPFKAGMIVEPEIYRTQPLIPAGGLSARDRSWIAEVYPPIDGADLLHLEPFVSTRLTLAAGAQFNAVFTPEETRNYTIETFGATDMVLVLFEEIDSKPHFLAGDDDSGADRNARIRVRLRKGQRYHVRARLYFAWDSGASALMVY